MIRRRKLRKKESFPSSDGVYEGIIRKLISSWMKSWMNEKLPEDFLNDGTMIRALLDILFKKYGITIISRGFCVVCGLLMIIGKLEMMNYYSSHQRTLCHKRKTFARSLFLTSAIFQKSRYNLYFPSMRCLLMIKHVNTSIESFSNFFDCAEHGIE